MFRRRKQRELDLERELRDHLELEARELRESGLNPEDAHYAALRSFGNTTLAKEATRDMWGWTVWERILQDVRYAGRTLGHSPGFTAVAVASLALGIGANTAIFSLLNAVVLRPLPVPDPQQLVQCTYTYPSNGPNNWNSYFGYPELDRIRTRATTLTGVFGGVSMGRMNVLSRGVSGLAQGVAYTDNIFSVLQVSPQHGRLLSAGDDGAEAPVAVLSDRFWRLRFAADAGVVGEKILINEIPFTVVGVAPAGFAGLSLGSTPDLWLPLHSMELFKPDRKRWTEPFTSWLVIAGRLRPGVSRQQAEAELDVIHRQLMVEQIATYEGRNRESMQQFVRESHLVLRSAESGTVSGLRENYSFPLKLLMWVAGMVVLIACANVANLLLARASNRRREIAVRLALGAGRRRVIRQLLTESLLLSSMGGAAALMVAWWGSALLIRTISTGDAPLPVDVRPDWWVFGFTAAVSVITGVLFGLAPALRSTRIDPGPALKEGARQSTGASRALDRGLVVAQVALSVVLITGAGLFTRTLQKLWSVDVGYNRDNVLMFSVDAKLGGYNTSEKARGLYLAIVDRLRAMPGARSATVSVVRPLDDTYYLVDRVNEVDGRQLPDREAVRVAWNAMGPGYFVTAGTPLVMGRDFDLQKDDAGSRVVIVNESLARKLFPGQNPLGHRLAGAEIIGVVKDSLYGGAHEQPRPVLYRSLLQLSGNLDPSKWAGVGGVSFEVRYSGGAGMVDAVRHEVARVDRNLPLFHMKTLREQTEDSLLRERLLAMLSTFFGALALLLACLGLYGLMAYAVTRRTSEIGIRMALGAGRYEVVRLVLREAVWLAVAGIAVGVPLALWTARYVKTLLFGITVTDPVTIVFAVGALAGVAALAGYLPARRASRVDPMVALRYE